MPFVRAGEARCRSTVTNRRAWRAAMTGGPARERVARHQNACTDRGGASGQLASAGRRCQGKWSLTGGQGERAVADLWPCDGAHGSGGSGSG
jgi:hypothetical protein